jgi:plastocyanin
MSTMTRLIVALLSLLVLAACAGPAATPSVTPALSAAVDVLLKDFKIVPATTSVPANVTFTVHSDGPTPHNFNVRDETGSVVVSSKDLRKGESDTVVGQLVAGTYTFFCAFAGHESLGMHGTLTVAAN